MEHLLWRLFEQKGDIGTYLFYKAFQNSPASDNGAETKIDLDSSADIGINKPNWDTPCLDVNQSV